MNHRHARETTRHRIMRLAALVIASAGWLAIAAATRAEDQRSDASSMVLKTKEGLNFKVPADWPIEKRNGILGPIPVEEYLARKFGALENRLQSLERQASALDLRLRVAEEALQKPGRRLQSSEAAPTPSATTPETSNATTPASTKP